MTENSHPHVAMLRTLYKDFSLLETYAADDIRLHQADRQVGTVPIRGRRAVLAYEKALLGATGGTLDMDVQSIQANDQFGSVLGTLRATHPRTVAMPFCGLWRFSGGLVVEHWENAYDASALLEALSEAS